MKSFRLISGIIAIIIGLVILIYPIYSTRSFWVESNYLGSGLFQLPLILMYVLAAGFSLAFIKEGFTAIKYSFIDDQEIDYIETTKRVDRANRPLIDPITWIILTIIFVGFGIIIFLLLTRV